MTKFNPKTKKEQKTEVAQPQIQLVPFERYAYEAIRAISINLGEIKKDISVIKERLVFEDQNKKGK